MSRLAITSTSMVDDVCRMLLDALQAEDLIDEYFSGDTVPDQPFLALVQSYRWIACYPVTGGSEGHSVVPSSAELI